MQSGQIAGIVLILVGILDPVLAFLVIGPRLQDPNKRTIMTVSMCATGLTMLVLGVAFLAGAVKVP